MTAENVKEKLEVGDIAPAGHSHEGYIYAGTPLGEPLWVSQYASRVMNHWDALVWARMQGGALPTREQGIYLYDFKEKGAFKTLFNGISSRRGLDRCIWLAEISWERLFAKCEDVRDGKQRYIARESNQPVLCVRR